MFRDCRKGVDEREARPNFHPDLQKEVIMKRSDDLKEFALAFSKAQALFKGATKDSDNPFFKSKYADMASVLAAVKEGLAAHGFSVLQPTSINPEGFHYIETILLHSSGQFISSETFLPSTDGKPQTLGSAMTYMRRYALQSLLGVAAEDDDGNAAQAGSKAPISQPAKPPIKSATTIKTVQRQDPRPTPPLDFGDVPI